ncbi:DUF624 domain-containing protein [Gracilibacillus oryzae]|uniref:DUF624 domain-containing protein n=1 Tax=Gracilibacillus oryzae TaxID=1672701 RepID=A0A7C8GQ22_9BACI|nr:DUF624 domain-containing protein [Gracilibacillus oryzae]KAB8125814.1 DUF624 domain-containing protein [Gracilibacillus oryzae]
MQIYDNRIYLFLEKTVNFFLLNLIWLLASLPIITSFPATNALYAVIHDWRNDKATGVFRPFFHHFRKNFLKSFWIGCIWFFTVFILCLDFVLIHEYETGWSYMALLSFLFLLLMIVLFMTAYLIPISVLYPLSLFQTFKQSFFYSLMFFPTTIMIIGLISISVLIVLFYPIAAFFLFSFVTLIIHRLIDRMIIKVEKLLNNVRL